MTPQQANLATCPFCGSANIKVNERDQMHFAMCHNCTAEGPAIEGVGSADNAMREWNRRAPAPTSEPGAREAVIAVARKILQEALDGVVVHPCDEFDESVRAKGLYGHMAELYAALATPASPAVQAAPLAPSKRTPTHEQSMAGYAVACKFGVFENRAFTLSDEMFAAFAATDPAPLVAQASLSTTNPRQIPDNECVQGKCACPTTGCWKECVIRRYPLMHVLAAPALLQTQASPLVEDAQRIVAGRVE